MFTIIYLPVCHMSKTGTQNTIDLYLHVSPAHVSVCETCTLQKQSYYIQPHIAVESCKFYMVQKCMVNVLQMFYLFETYDAL